MSVLAVPASIENIIIPLNPTPLPDASILEKRIIYFETSREGTIDRQGEDIAADCIWAARHEFIQQGNLDINHFSWLGNPPGTGMRPEYVIGLPLDVRRAGPSIHVKGEIFKSLTPPPEPLTSNHTDPTFVGSNGGWADRFWHSITHLTPPMRWYPSIFGKIHPEGAELQIRNGRRVRFITGPFIWMSVGFAQRAQNQALPPITLEPTSVWSDVLSKATPNLTEPLIAGNTLIMSTTVLAKAVLAAKAVTTGDPHLHDPKGAWSGIPAIRKEALERPKTLRDLYERTKSRVMRALLKGRIEGTIPAVTEAFRKAGVPHAYARKFAEKLGLEAFNSLNQAKNHLLTPSTPHTEL